MSFFKRRKREKEKVKSPGGMIRVYRLNRPAEKQVSGPKGSPAHINTTGLPSALAEDVRACLRTYSDLQEKRADISHDLTFIVDQIMSSYLPETIQQYRDANRQGQADLIVDGVYTAAQVCQQNIRMIKLKLENIIEETNNKTQTEVLIQRNFLMEQLDIDNAPEADAPNELRPLESKKVTGKSLAEANSIPALAVGERVRLDLRRLVNNNGGLDNFQREWNWKVKRDYSSNRKPVGIIKRARPDRGCYDVQIYFHGLVTNIPAEYLSSHPKPEKKATGKANKPSQKSNENKVSSEESTPLNRGTYSLRRATHVLGCTEQEINALSKKYNVTPQRTTGGHRRWTQSDIDKIRAGRDHDKVNNKAPDKSQPRDLHLKAAEQFLQDIAQIKRIFS